MSRVNSKKSDFARVINKELLPSVPEYMAQNGLYYPTDKLWNVTFCPFHDDAYPSLSIHKVIGCFCCFACGAKGGDLITFHMKLYRMSFVDACTDLGIWEDKK